MSFHILEEEPGYLLGYCLNKEEYALILSWIRESWEHRILSRYPQYEKELSSLSLKRYHSLSSKLEHGTLWAKDHRIFSKKQVSILQEMSIFEQLRSDLGNVVIADIEGLGYPEVYWRLVRPLPYMDVADAHADAWFYTITNKIPEERQQRLCKFWLSMLTSPYHSGLSVQESSHKQTWNYGAEERHGRQKPVFLDDENRLDLKPLPLKNGEGVVFHTQLIHKGIAHTIDETRYSIEFALERV